MVRSSLRALLASVVSLSVAVSLPSVAYAQAPAPAGESDTTVAPTADRDLDGVQDAADACPDVYGAPPTGCPPKAPVPVTDRDGDGVADDKDQCPDLAAVNATGCPEAEPEPEPEPAPPAPVVPQLTGDAEYERVVDSLPDDFRIDYAYVVPERKRQKKNKNRKGGDPDKAIKGLRTSGTLLLVFGSIGLLSTATAGALLANSGDEELATMKEDELANPSQLVDADAREKSIGKGETGNDLLRIGAPVTGAAAVLGLSLLLGARSLRKKHYGSPKREGGSNRGSSNLSSSSKRKLTVYGVILMAYGAAGIIGGAILASNDDDKKKKNGKILLGFSGAAAGVGALMLIPVIIDNNKKKGAYLRTGPVFVRGGGGLGLGGHF